MSHLPPLCLPVMDKAPASELTPTRLGFPTEFPYEFDSPAFSSPGDSTDESSDDEEDFLASLSRRLAPSTQRLPPPSETKRHLAATSPQSTLSGLGSYSNSGSRSPILPPSHTTSFRRDTVLDLISAAAGEVARLKLGSHEPHLLPRQNAAFQTDRYVQQQRLLLHQMWLCSQSRIKSTVNQELAFENFRTNAAVMRQHAGTPLKRPSTGTGVFLPRRYPTTTTGPSEPIKKPVPVNTTAMLQSNVNFDESRQSQFDYECMIARSKLLAREGNYRAVGCLNQERRLPQDWMY